jgi:tRNA A-37 threonylcarbamoyl transferase component Bud32
MIPRILLTPRIRPPSYSRTKESPRPSSSDASRIYAIERERKLQWVKVAVPAKHRFWHRWQNLLAAVLRMPSLRWTADTAGDAALAREARIIARLRARGVRVPEVIALTEDRLILSDLGPDLDRQMKAASSTAQAEAVALRGIAALQDLHARGGWHGNPLLRNLAGTEPSIGFIDFEEDPGAVMSVVSCQTRDIILYLLSLAPYASRYPRIVDLAAATYLKNANAAVIAQLRIVRWLLAAPAILLWPFHRLQRGDLPKVLRTWRALWRVLGPATGHRTRAPRRGTMSRTASRP